MHLAHRKIGVWIHFAAASLATQNAPPEASTARKVLKVLKAPTALKGERSCNSARRPFSFSVLGLKILLRIALLSYDIPDFFPPRVSNRVGRGLRGLGYHP